MEIKFRGLDMLDLKGHRDFLYWCRYPINIWMDELQFRGEVRVKAII